MKDETSRKYAYRDLGAIEESFGKRYFSLKLARVTGAKYGDKASHGRGV